MTSPSTTAADRRPVAVVLLTALAVGLVALVGWWLMSRDLFVMTEARGYALYRPPIDPLRFLAFPELDWGSGRLLGQLQFHLTNMVCGVDASCFNAVGALELALAASLLVVHTRQVTGSLVVALVAAAFWLTSPAVLGITLWQATRFDVLAFAWFLVIAMTWWWALGRTKVTRAGSVLFVAVSIVLLALAFNSKEITYALLVVLPAIAVLRGVAVPGGIRRNLLLAIVPLAYAAWFITWGLGHMDPAYAARSQGIDAIEGIASLVRSALGIDDAFLYLAPEGDAERWAPGLAAAWGLLAVLLLVMVAVTLLSLARRRRSAVRPRTAAAPSAPRSIPGRAADVVQSIPAELYLALVAVLTLGILARSATPASYYLLLPVWALSTLLLLGIRRMAAVLGSPRTLPVLVTGAWGAVHLLTLAVLLAPGSTYDQLQWASVRMREIGSILRGVYAEGRAYGPILWRTLEAPDTQFLVLRDPAQGRNADGSYAVGGDLMPYLLGDRRWAARAETLASGTVAELAARPAGERELVVVIDGDYRLRLLTYEGRPLMAPIP